MWVASQDDPFQDDVQRIAFGQLTIHDWRQLMLGGVELIDPEDVDGCWWEVVVAVEGTIEIAFIIFFYLFDEFRLIRTIDHP